MTRRRRRDFASLEGAQHPSARLALDQHLHRSVGQPAAAARWNRGFRSRMNVALGPARLRPASFLGRQSISSRSSRHRHLRGRGSTLRGPRRAGPPCPGRRRCHAAASSGSTRGPSDSVGLEDSSSSSKERHRVARRRYSRPKNTPGCRSARSRRFRLRASAPAAAWLLCSITSSLMTHSSMSSRDGHLVHEVQHRRSRGSTAGRERRTCASIA